MTVWEDTGTVQPSSFQIYCHQDSKCTLKIDRQEPILEFEDVSQAIRTVVVELNRAKGESRLTIYSTLGNVILQAAV